MGNVAEVAEGIFFLPSKVQGKTDPDGWIRFRAAWTNTVHLRFTPRNWALINVMWGSDPRDPSYKAWTRQDLGQHKLERGGVITGRLLDLKGRPRPRQKLAVVGGEGDFGRKAETNADGQFAFAPLPPGTYIVVAERQYPGFWDPEYPVLTETDAVIKPIAVDLHRGKKPDPLEVHEAETVALVIHHLDSQGRPVRGFPVLLGGMSPAAPEERMPEDRGPTDLPDNVFHPLTEGPQQYPSEPALDLVWAIRVSAGQDGTIVLRVPRGLEASLEFANVLSNASCRVRLDNDGPLENDFDPELGVLDGERREITVVWYKAPTVVARINFDGGKLPNDARVIIFRNANGIVAEEAIQKLPNGRFRSRRLLPDLEYSARAVAEGHEGPEVKFNLPEGGVKELTLELRRAPEPKKEDDP